MHEHARYSLAWTWVGNLLWFIITLTFGSLIFKPLGPVAMMVGGYVLAVLAAWLPRKWIRHRRMQALFTGNLPVDRESVLTALDVKAPTGGLVLTAGAFTLRSPLVTTSTWTGRPHNGSLVRWLFKVLAEHEAQLRAAGGPVVVRHASQLAADATVAQAKRVSPPFLELVDRVLAAQVPPRQTLLIQRNQTDATLLVGGETLCVFLEVQPGEAIASTLTQRLEAAHASERELVRKGLEDNIVWVVLCGVSRPLGELGLKSAGKTQARLNFLRIDGGVLETDSFAFVAGRNAAFAAQMQGRLRQALGSTAAPLSAEQHAALEVAGEHTLATEGDAKRRTRESLPVFAVLAGFWALLSLLAVVFGGAGANRVMLPMGAYTPGRFGDGEWWRVFTGGHLHLGFQHLLSNLTGLLYVLGPVSGALGRWRTLVLFLASSLGGGVLSMVFSASWGAGASGGVFGVMGAALVLSWRHPELVPPRSRRRVLVMMVVLLGINFFLSLMPAVSTLGHLGGLLVGAALVVIGAARAGMPPLDSPATPPRFDGVFKGVAAVIAVMTLGAFVLSWSRHQPWTHRWPGPLEAREVNGVSLRVPANFGPFVRSGHTFISGAMDALIIEVERKPETRPPVEALEAAKTELAASMPKDVTWPAPLNVSGGGRPELRGAAKGPAGTHSSHLVFVENGERVSLMVFWEGTLPEATVALVPAIVESASAVR